MQALASAILMNVGAIASLWGIVWYAFDHNARAPGYLIGGGLIALLAGWAI